MRKPPDYYAKRLGDIEGYLPDGKTPKLRLVFAPEALRPHGKLQGKPKYIDPNTGEVMKFWVVECHYPAAFCGSREAWNYDLLGTYPADCNEDCCNGGFWGFRMPISVSGEYIELTEETLHSIEQKLFADFEWSMLSEIQRQEAIDSRLSREKQMKDETVWHEQNENRDHYLTHQLQEDNADNRVWSFGNKITIGGKEYDVPTINRPGLNEPVGKVVI